MNAQYALGLGLTGVGLVAYVAGLWVDYPARSFSVTAVMVGLTVAAIGRSKGQEAAA